MFMLHSGGPQLAATPWPMIASPMATYRFTDRSELIVTAGCETNETVQRLASAAQSFTHDPLIDLDAVLAVTRVSEGDAHAHDGIDIRGRGRGWVGVFSYELGARIEPAARAHGRAERERDWPLIELGWCVNAPSSIANEQRGDWQAGALSPTVSREQHIDRVAQTIEHICAGDIFQANITQQFTAPFTGNTRNFARAALEVSGAWYGSMLELTNGKTIVSMSPELFLAFNAKSRSIVSRPIKGTRSRELDPSELARSEKDKAELAMIVDLMRNDLGRVCEIGSIRVPSPRTIETHGAVHQGVGEVTGTVRADVTVSDLLRATFPPGSVTGAPKIRAMQIIDELETSPRGPYCGAIGMISDRGDITLGVAIRTITLSGIRPNDRFDSLTGTLSYGAGGGIVVDSDPAKEFDEALDKTALLRELIDAQVASQTK